ncbi:MAG: sulfatase family protein [Armatimonadota bacterium]
MPCMSRRRFLAGTIALPLFNIISKHSDSEKPNFLLILTDDHRWDWLGCSGHPWFRSPNIDRIAQEGARFANAFATTSLCSPSRASFLTGKYAHSHGVKDNQTPLNPRITTFAQLLQKDGYDTAFIGKWHMDEQEGPQPGFSHWVAPKGHGTYYDPTFNINGKWVTINGYTTDITTKLAIEWLRKPQNEPFCLCLWHKAPHGNFECAVRHSRLYSDAEFVPRPNVYDALEGKPAWVRKVARDFTETDNWNMLCQRVKDYSRTLAAVDESTGQILRTLEDMQVLDNTVVVFAGDNGFFFGEHGLLDKRAAYEESIRIPLLVRYPKLVRPGAIIKPLVLNIDLCPTFLELANIKVPAQIEGKSLKPVLRGELPDNWRREFLYEYFIDAEAKKRPPIFAVRTEHWKYITYPGTNELSELYDLQEDPLELKNLAQEAIRAPIVDQMKSKLEQLTRELN